MKCLIVRNELKAYIDGELGPVTRWHVSKHLAHCADCQQEVKTMTDLANEMQNIHGTPAPEGLRERVLGEISFEPANNVRVPFAIPVMPMVAVALMLVVAAVVFPVFMQSKGGVRAREAARMSPAFQAKPADLDSDARTAPGGPLTKTLTGGVAVSPSAPVSQLIVKTADMTIEVKDFQKANDRVILIAKSSGGYVTNSSAASDAGTPSSGTLTIEVPVDSFERAVKQLGEMGKIKSNAISGKDVTGDVVDLESRLRNKRAEERQYLEIMNKAHRVTDIVTVSNELYRVRGEIEEMTGRVKQLRSSAAMSTINLSLSEKPKQSVPVSSIRQTFTDALASMGSTLSGLVSLVIWLAIYSPFWALPIAFVFYYRKRTASQSQI